MRPPVKPGVTGFFVVKPGVTSVYVMPGLTGHLYFLLPSLYCKHVHIINAAAGSGITSAGGPFAAIAYMNF